MIYEFRQHLMYLRSRGLWVCKFYYFKEEMQAQGGRMGSQGHTALEVEPGFQTNPGGSGKDSKVRNGAAGTTMNSFEVLEV